MPGFQANRFAPVFATRQARIQGPIDQVWSVLSDIEHWPVWNPAVGHADLKGPLEPGTRFDWTAGGLPIRSTLEVVDRPFRIGWSGKAPLIRARHVWTLLRDGDDETTVITSESFDGPLPRLARGPLQRMLERALSQGLRDLARECELPRLPSHSAPRRRPAPVFPAKA